MQMWKQRTGSKATYSKLIKIFEQAGYQNCADNVRRIAQVSDSESDDSSGSGEEHTQQEQPPTYPSSQQQEVLTQQSLASPKSTETYVIVNKDNPPKGKINASTCCTYKVMSYIKLLC